MRRFLLIPAAILLCGILAVLAGYGISLRLKPELDRAQRTMLPEDKVSLGGSLQYKVTVTLPAAAPAPELAIVPPKDTVLGGPVRVTRGRYRWHRQEWNLEAVLRAVKPGAATGGKAVLSVKGRFAAAESFPIPDFVIEPVKAEGNDLDLADKIEVVPPRPRWPYWAAGAVLVLLAVLAAWKFRRKKQERMAPLPPWVQAERALELLAADVAAKSLPLGAAFLRLTDVVRKYLEERYHLPVTSRTTDEFMMDLREDSPLPETDQPFLRDFLTSADLVKFARLPPDENALRHAVEGARELVHHTIPAEQEEKHV